MSERTVYTEDQKNAIKVRRDERNAATKTLLAMIIDGKDENFADAEFLTDLRSLANIAVPKSGSGNGTKSAGRVSVMSKVAELFVDNTEVDEITVFQDLHLGRAEMATAIKNILKKSKPEDRLWINFNVEEGMYVLEGTGADAPEAWTGYLPVEEVIED